MSRAGKGNSAYGGHTSHGEAASVAQHAPRTSAASGLKSLGMLQDLQEYMSAFEQIPAIHPAIADAVNTTAPSSIPTSTAQAMPRHDLLPSSALHSPKPHTSSDLGPYNAPPAKPSTVGKLPAVGDSNSWSTSWPRAASRDKSRERGHAGKASQEYGTGRLERAGDAAATSVVVETLVLGTSEMGELPPRLRAMIEDNKVLREKVRKYRGQAQELERQLGSRDKRLYAMEDELGRLREAAQSSFRPAEAAATEASLRSQLEQAQRALSNSESHVRILEHKADTAAKAAKQAALQAQREKAALQKQVDLLKEVAEGKDKEIRAALLEARQLRGKLEEVRRAGARRVQDLTAQLQAQKHALELSLLETRRFTPVIEPDMSPEEQAEAQAAANVRALLAQAQMVEVLRQSQPGLADLGLELLPDPAAGVPAPPEDIPDDEPGIPVDEAALMIQSAFRGHVVRKKLRAVREGLGEGAVLVQAGRKSQTPPPAAASPTPAAPAAPAAIPAPCPVALDSSPFITQQATGEQQPDSSSAKPSKPALSRSSSQRSTTSAKSTPGAPAAAAAGSAGAAASGRASREKVTRPGLSSRSPGRPASSSRPSGLSTAVSGIQRKGTSEGAGGEARASASSLGGAAGGGKRLSQAALDQPEAVQPAAAVKAAAVPEQQQEAAGAAAEQCAAVEPEAGDGTAVAGGEEGAASKQPSQSLPEPGSDASFAYYNTQAAAAAAAAAVSNTEATEADAAGSGLGDAAGTQLAELAAAATAEEVAAAIEQQVEQFDSLVAGARAEAARLSQQVAAVDAAAEPEYMQAEQQQQQQQQQLVPAAEEGATAAEPAPVQAWSLADAYGGI